VRALPFCPPTRKRAEPRCEKKKAPIEEKKKKKSFLARRGKEGKGPFFPPSEGGDDCLMVEKERAPPRKARRPLEAVAGERNALSYIDGPSQKGVGMGA